MADVIIFEILDTEGNSDEPSNLVYYKERERDGNIDVSLIDDVLAYYDVDFDYYD